MTLTGQNTDQPLVMLFDCEHCEGVHEGMSSHADQFSGEWLYEVTCPEDGLTEWLVGWWLGRPVPEKETVLKDACASITRKGTRCTRQARREGRCTQHASLIERSAQDSETITVSDLADEYDITIQDVTRALGDDSLTEHDGVDAGMARDILNQQTILNISDRVQWNDGDHPVNFVREGEIFEFIPGGFVQVNYRDGTAYRSCTIRRDRLTKV